MNRKVVEKLRYQSDPLAENPYKARFITIIFPDRLPNFGPETATYNL